MEFAAAAAHRGHPQAGWPTDVSSVVPPVRVTDNLQLKAGEYVVLLKGAEIARYELAQNCELAIHAGAGPTGGVPALEGVPTREPAFGIPAVWIPAEAAEHARAKGFTVVDRVSAYSAHTWRSCCGVTRMNFFPGRTPRLFWIAWPMRTPKVIEDLVPKLLPMATVQKVMQKPAAGARLGFATPLYDYGSLGEAAAMTKNPILLTEYARQAIRRLLVKPYLNTAGELPAYFLDFAMEQAVEGAVEHGELASHLNLAPQRLRAGYRGSCITPRGGGGGGAHGDRHQFGGAVSFCAKHHRGSAAESGRALAQPKSPPASRVVSIGLIQ